MTILQNNSKIKYLIKIIGIATGLILTTVFVSSIIDKQNKQLTLAVLIFMYFFFLIMITIFIKRNKINTRVIGLCIPSFSRKMIVIYSILTIPLLYGVSLLWEWYQYISPLYIVWMFLVGIIEEVLFRGLMKDVFSEQTNKFYILISATIFSIFHIPTALASNPTEFSIFATLLTTFLVGIMLALVFTVSNSIYPTIIYHILHNIVFFLPLPNINNGVQVIIIMLIIFYLLYSKPEINLLNFDVGNSQKEK